MSPLQSNGCCCAVASCHVPTDTAYLHGSVSRLQSILGQLLRLLQLLPGSGQLALQLCVAGLQLGLPAV